MKKIGIVSVGRSDFGLIFHLIKQLKKSSKFKTLLFAAAGHYSSFSGNTINEISNKGIKIDYEIKCSNDDDSKNSTNISMSKAIKLFSENFLKSNIESIILFGDRYEMYAAAIAARNIDLKIFHIGGGCTTLGALDNMYRHNISILSDYHFVDLIDYKKKLCNFGIKSRDVYVVGSFGAASLDLTPKFSYEELKKKLNFELHSKYVIFTYHSTTIDTSNDNKFIKVVLDYFKNKNYQVIITNPNEDFNRKSITQLYNKYLSINNFVMVKNLGHEKYGNLLRYAQIMIGNSSSGIIEAESFNLPVVNLGKRQKGRICANNVLHVEDYNKSKIISKLNYILNKKKSKKYLQKIYFKRNTFLNTKKIIIKKLLNQ